MDLSEISRAVVTPGGFDMPPGGLNLRVPDHWDAQEVRMYRHKLRAILAFARANSINGHVMGAPLGCAKLGIIAAGKSYRDVLQCLGDMGLRQEELLQLGVSVYKVGLVWPLEPEGILEFTQGMREVLVVEEKRSFIETQVASLLPRSACHVPLYIF